MAKKSTVTADEAQAVAAAPPGQLGDWLDKVPDEVQEAADEYVKKKRAAAKAKERADTAKYNVIEAMKEHEIHKLRIDNGEKWIVCSQEDKLKIESHKTRASSSEED